MMKSTWKKLSAIGLAILMMVSLAVVPAFADNPTVTTATEMDRTYYTDSAGANLAGNPSLTIQKYVSQSTDPASPDTSLPIQGVKFKYLKVGGLYQLTLSNGGSVMAYGVTRAFATAVSLDDGTADYSDADRLYFIDGSEIQTAVQAADAAALDAGILSSVSAVETSEQGVIRATLDISNPYGLYLVVETDVSNAISAGKPIAITKVQAPFIVAIPSYINDVWNETVVANVKNSIGTADVEKKIVVGADETKHDGEEDVADTDITHIGDIVHYRLKGTVPAIPSGSSTEIKTYILTDQISKGLTAVTESGSVKIDHILVLEDGVTSTITLTAGTDFTVSGLTPISSADSEYDGGNQFTITFDDPGLTKLTQLAQTTSAKKEVYFYYSAVVNENAVIGPQAAGKAANSGNPNQVMLTYNTTGGPPEGFATTWDKVTHFTFGLDVTKEFEGTDPQTTTNVTFQLYNTATDGTPITLVGSDGVYRTPLTTDGDTTTDLKLDSSKKITISGLDEGTYYLEETKTEGGFNLLKGRVQVVLTPYGNVNNDYVDLIGSTPNDDYLGTLSDNNGSSGSGVLSLTVVNTKGFELPATGGAGIWMFVLGGALIIALGCGYYMVSRKKEQ